MWYFVSTPILKAAVNQEGFIPYTFCINRQVKARKHFSIRIDAIDAIDAI